MPKNLNNSFRIMHASILQIISINMSTKFDLRLFLGPLDQPLEVLVIFTLESWSHHIRMHLKNPPPPTEVRFAICSYMLPAPAGRGGVVFPSLFMVSSNQ